MTELPPDQICTPHNGNNTRTHPPGHIIDIWYLVVGRIAPELCCRSPPPYHLAFQAALREVSRQDGDLDLAIQYLHDIVANVPPEWMVFEQAGQLLNIIEWRRTYHQCWFSSNLRGRRMKPGKCGPYIAGAMALLQAGADDEGLELTRKIIEKSDSASDDFILAHLIRAAILICNGEITAGEDELRQIEELSSDTGAMD